MARWVPVCTVLNTVVSSLVTSKHADAGVVKGMPRAQNLQSSQGQNLQNDGSHDGLRDNDPRPGVYNMHCENLIT